MSTKQIGYFIELNGKTEVVIFQSQPNVHLLRDQFGEVQRMTDAEVEEHLAKEHAHGNDL